MTDVSHATTEAGTRGRARTPETRAKIAAAMTGRKFSDESRARMSASHVGKPAHVEHMERLRELNKRVITPEMIDTIHECRARSMGQESTAQAVGISRRTLVAWLRENMPSTIAPGARDRHTKYSAETLAAREALIREHYPVGMPRAHLINLCNQIPGRAITDHALEKMLMRMQVHRNPGIVRRLDAVFLVWTDERLALLRQLRGVDGLDWVAIAERITALPGQPVGADAARRQCSKAGIRLPIPAKVSGPKPKPKRVRAPAVRKQRLPAPVPVPARAQDTVGEGTWGRFNYAKAPVTREVRVPVPDEPIILPMPNSDGVVEVRLLPLMQWCAQNDIHGFRGDNVDALNKLLALRGHRPVLVTWL